MPTDYPGLRLWSSRQHCRTQLASGEAIRRWTFVPNWGHRISRPGLMKTPAVRASQVLKRLEIEAKAGFAAAA